MSITGSFTDCSVPEIFRLIEKGEKTGLLSISALSGTSAKPDSVYYIWVQHGSIVAAANRLDGQGLVSLITKQQWVSDRAFAKVLKWCCPLEQPLGLCLKNQGILSAVQLEQLFNVQILQQFCPLFQIHEGMFKFDQNVPIPNRELTGSSLSITEAILMALRWLPNWEALSHQLPHPGVSLANVSAGKPQLKLDSLESKVWECSKRMISLKAIAIELRIPVEKVQQIAFRLIAVGLVTVQSKSHQVDYTLPTYKRKMPLLFAWV